MSSLSTLLIEGNATQQLVLKGTVEDLNKVLKGDLKNLNIQIKAAKGNMGGGTITMRSQNVLMKTGDDAISSSDVVIASGESSDLSGSVIFEFILFVCSVNISSISS